MTPWLRRISNAPTLCWPSSMCAPVLALEDPKRSELFFLVFFTPHSRGSLGEGDDAGEGEDGLLGLLRRDNLRALRPERPLLVVDAHLILAHQVFRGHGVDLLVPEVSQHRPVQLVARDFLLECARLRQSRLRRRSAASSPRALASVASSLATLHSTDASSDVCFSSMDISQLVELRFWRESRLRRRLHLSRRRRARRGPPPCVPRAQGPRGRR